MRAKSRIAVTLVVLSILFQGWAFTMVPEAKIYTDGPPVPDIRVSGYSPQEVRDLLIQIGEKGRANYLVAQAKVDFIIPALGAAMFLMGIWALADGLIWRGRLCSSRRALALASIGVIGPIFDCGENLLIAQAMRAGPLALAPRSVELASLCTQLKFSFVAVSILLIVLLGLMRWRQGRSA